MRQPFLLTKSITAASKPSQIGDESDTKLDADAQLRTRNHKPPQSLPRTDLRSHAHSAVPKGEETSKQGRRSRYDGSINLPPCLDGAEDGPVRSETAHKAGLTLKRKRATDTNIANAQSSAGSRSEHVANEVTPAKGTLASKSSNKGRHARVAIPVRSTTQPARRLDLVPGPLTAPSLPPSLPHNESDEGSDASEDIVSPVDRSRRRRKEHAVQDACLDKPANGVDQPQASPKPAPLETALKKAVPRVGRRIGRPKAESETGNSTPVPEGNVISLSAPTANEVCKVRERLRSHIGQFEDAHQRYLKQSLSRARQQMKRYTEADQAKMSTSISKMPMASLLKSPSHAPSSSLKVPSFLTFSKPADSAPSKAQTSTKHLQQLRIIPYRTETPSVPPYDYHSRAKVNKLALNDRSLVAMPNIEQHDVLSDTGAIDPNEDADFIEEVAEHFDMGLPFEHDRDEVVYRLERYKQLRPTLRRFLDGEGCSDEAIVRLFLDKDIKVGGPRSPYAPKILRAQALEDKCHLQQYLNKATRILKMLSPTLLAQQLDVALRIAFAFQEELGMSIWPVSEVWLRQHIRPQAAGEPQRSDFLAGGVCRVCQCFECKKHGSIPDRKSYSSESKANLDPVLINDHKPVQSSQSQLLTMKHGPELEDEVGLIRTPSIRTTKGGRSSQSRALSSNSLSPETRRQTPLATEPDAAHTDRCSKHCVLDWKALDAAPYTDIEETLRRFNAKDQALARPLLPAFRGSPRASCIIAAALNKQCSHVHYLLQQLELLTAPAVESTSGEPPFPAPSASLPRSAKWWAENTKSSQIAERKPFYPCSHQGSCAAANCSCFQQSIHCEKSCGCSTACDRRFRGCRCEQKGIPCRQGRCDCYRLMRECDPDLCNSCGAIEALDPASRDLRPVDHSCGNVSMQRGIPKRLITGTSQVKDGGFGLFAGEFIKSGDLLGEYKGEVVSKQEAERRKTLYKRMARHYTFDLNLEQEIDGTHSGNKMRFVNNSRLPRNINCEQYHMLCNTVSRIGLYATRDIQPGEELFFDYGYPADQYKHFGEKKFTSVVAVKEKTKKATAPATGHEIEASVQSRLDIEAVFRDPSHDPDVGGEERELMIRPASFRSDDEADEDYDEPEPEPEVEKMGQASMPEAPRLGRPVGQKRRGKKRKRFA